MSIFIYSTWPSVMDGKFDILEVKYLDEKKGYRAEFFFYNDIP